MVGRVFIWRKGFLLEENQVENNTFYDTEESPGIKDNVSIEFFINLAQVGVAGGFNFARL